MGDSNWTLYFGLAAFVVIAAALVGAGVAWRMPSRRIRLGIGLGVIALGLFCGIVSLVALVLVAGLGIAVFTLGLRTPPAEKGKGEDALEKPTDRSGGDISRRTVLLSLVLSGVFCAVVPALALGVPFKSVGLFCFVFFPILYPLSLPSMPFRLVMDPIEGIGLCSGYALAALFVWMLFRCLRRASSSPRKVLAAHAALLALACWCWWMGMRMEGDWMEGGPRKKGTANQAVVGTSLRADPHH